VRLLPTGQGTEFGRTAALTGAEPPVSHFLKVSSARYVLTRPLRLARLSSGRGLSVPAHCALRRDLRRGHHDDGPVSVLEHRVGDAAEP
jgi:hypothetical protein